MSASIKGTAVAFLAALTVSACATDVVDLDRTQANRVDKSIFVGEWYVLPTVVENQYNQGLLFEGLQGSFDRVRWDVRENELIAYRSYETLEGAEANIHGTEFFGAPVAAFAVTSHFDVIREYNTSTGEQSNVLVENTTDRPWYEREFMRVDWSTNVLQDGYKLAAGVGAMSGAPYYVQENEVDNPYRAEVTATNINIVNNYHLQNDIYTCYYTFLDPTFCGTSNAKLKLSFRKVDENNDYELLHYPDGLHVTNERTGRPFQGSFRPDWQKNITPFNLCGGPNSEPTEECAPLTVPMFERFGYFRTQRQAYDDEYQWTRDGRIFLINRHNIWAKSTEAGEKLDPKFRPTKKITYWTNPDFPDDADLWEANNLMTQDWDGAFRQTVASLKGVSPDQVDSIFEIKKNNCNIDAATSFASSGKHWPALRSFGIDVIAKGNLKRACAVLEHESGGAFKWQKPGDIRYSFNLWVDTPQQAGPLGYGPSGADPVTGEIISATANLYGASVDTFASYAADVISLMNGKLELDDVVEGENIRQHLARNRANLFGQMSPAKLSQLAGHTMHNHPLEGVTGEGLNSQRADGSAMSQLKMARMKGSAMERELLMSDDIKRVLYGPMDYQPGEGTPDDSQLSPLEWMSDDLAKKHRGTMMGLAKQNIMMAEWSDDGMVSLAHELRDMDWEEVYRFMRKGIYRGVQAHEIGHTLGLRHNFGGSADAVNYHSEFWESFRMGTNKLTGQPGGEVVREENGVPTKAERLMYSSIMDYDARFYGDSLEGIGPYDVAAIKFGYGQLVEVFDESVIPPADRSVWSYVNYESYEDRLYFADYANAPLVLAPRDAQGNAIGAAPQNLWRRRDVRFEELYDAYSRFLNDNDVGFIEEVLATRSLPEAQQILGSMVLPMAPVPYNFCPDELTYSTNVLCQPYDKGGNLLEVTQDRMERFEKYYFFTNFKRDRFTFNDFAVDGYLSRTMGRYFIPMSDTFRAFLYRSRWLGSFAQGGVPGAIDQFIDWQASVAEGLNFLVSVIERPEPGNYCLDGGVYKQWQGTQASFDAGCAQKLDVPVGEGRYFNTQWTDEYIYKPTTIGTFWDKYAAYAAMTQNQSNFYRDFGDILDQGTFTLSYWRGGLTDEMLNVFKSSFTGEASDYAWGATSGGELVRTPAMDIYGNLPPVQAPIESSSSWTLRYYGILLPMMQFNSMYDYTPDFSWYSRICLSEYRDCMAFESSDVTTVTYVDPFTNLEYVAPRRGTGAEFDRYVGAKMLDDANTAKSAYLAALSTYNGNPSAGNKAALDASEVKLQELNSFIDVVREAGYRMEFGN